MTKEENNIIIATKDIGKALKIFFNKAPFANEITINYTNEFIGTVEILTKKLGAGAGWKIINKGIKNTTNKKCKHNHKGYCTHKLKTTKQELTIKCTESTRENCEHYEQEKTTTFKTNYIELTVVGQVRSLRK